ncbi:MAG TPA: hypothetical protein VHC22_31600 [Pirellulales bacterium]|nr:hypothetical protein [Pirellulales bacterium]
MNRLLSSPSRATAVLPIALALLWMLTEAAFAAPPANGQVRFASAPQVVEETALETPAGKSPFTNDMDDGSELSFRTPAPIEQYLGAVPPPDPPPPQWGSLDQPLPQPPEIPTYNYLISAPPRGAIQPWPKPYERPIDDPDQLLFDHDRMNMPIDLYRPDGLAPPGVTGDHTLKTGRALFSYRYSVVGYQASLIGTHLATAGRVLQQFNNAPQQMYKQQHLMLLEYAPTDDLTMMAQLPIQENSINYLTSAGNTVHDANTQIGDISLWALYVLKRWKNQQIHANFGMSIPTNLVQTDNQFSVPGSVHLSYPIRIGSGSYELLPGLTYRGQTENWTWGVQSITTIPLGFNRYHYELGNQVDVNAWGFRRLSQRFAASARLHGMAWGNIRGMDPNLTPTLVETNAPSLQGGTRVDLLFGGQFYIPWVRVPGNWFSIESGFPIYQNLHGPQPRATWLLYGGWNMMW